MTMFRKSEMELEEVVTVRKRILKHEQQSVRSHLDNLVKAHTNLENAEKVLEDAEQELNEYRNRNRCL